MRVFGISIVSILKEKSGFITLNTQHVEKLGFNLSLVSTLKEKKNVSFSPSNCQHIERKK